MTLQVVADLQTVLFQIQSIDPILLNLRGKLHFRMNLKRNLSEAYPGYGTLCLNSAFTPRVFPGNMMKIMEDKSGPKSEIEIINLTSRMTCRFGFGQFLTDR